VNQMRNARDELATFLKAKRQGIEPTSAGLQTGNRRRTSGLRREEVALLSGVSVTWYTWLEQARDIKPSRQVLDALARTLQLSPTEHRYVLRLTGHQPEHLLEDPHTALPAHVQDLLDALGQSPAYAITDSWSILGWNRAYEMLYPHISVVDPAERNLLWLVFTEPHVRELLADWKTDSLRFLAQFRSEVGWRIDEPAFDNLVTKLRTTSEHFRRGWDSYGLDQFTSRLRTFHHSRVGTLVLGHHRVTLFDCPDLHIVAYTAAPDTDTAAKLALMHR